MRAHSSLSIRSHLKLITADVSIPEDLLFELRSLAIQDGIGIPSLIRPVMAEYHWGKHKERQQPSHMTSPAYLATLPSKVPLTIPLGIRNKLGILPGDKVTLTCGRRVLEIRRSRSSIHGAQAVSLSRGLILSTHSSRVPTKQNRALLRSLVNEDIDSKQWVFLKEVAEQ